MSLDLWITDVVESEVYECNITHNVAGMWKKAGVYESLYMSEGQRCGDHIAILEKGLQDMRDNYSDYMKLNPANGWGSALSAITFLEQTIAAFKENPNGKIGISK